MVKLTLSDHKSIVKSWANTETIGHYAHKNCTFSRLAHFSCHHNGKIPQKGALHMNHMPSFLTKHLFFDIYSPYGLHEQGIIGCLSEKWEKLKKL